MRSNALISVLTVMGSTAVGPGAAADPPPDVQVRALSGGGYVITLTNPAVTNVAMVQAGLTPLAQKICADKPPQFGHYRFRSMAPASATAAKPGFVMEQEVSCVGDVPAPLPEYHRDAIAYPDVATARKALLARADAKSYTDGKGWLVIQFPYEYTLWTFAPETDPAYPAVVRRIITQGPDKSTYIDMGVLCQASKAACDDLVRRFGELNEKIKASLSHH